MKSKNPTLVFLSETKAIVNWMKGFQRKLELTQGISVPSDGCSGGLAMIWHEAVDIRFMSCSHSHIDVVVHGEGGASLWRATGFYGHLDTSKRHTSWELLETLKNQSTLSWVVFNDFNEIVHPEEKLGWLDQDADQMWNFRECLGRCGLLDLGFMGQSFTWCNGRFREQRKMVRLDRFVADERWIEKFSKAQVRHISMSASNHCLLALFLQKKRPFKPMKKRFLFEAMWVRDGGCR